MAGPKGGGGPSDQDGIRDDLLQVGSRLQDGHKIRPPKARSVEGRLGRRASLLSQSAHVVGAYWWRRPSGRKRQRPQGCGRYHQKPWGAHSAAVVLGPRRSMYRI